MARLDVEAANGAHERPSLSLSRLPLDVLQLVLAFLPTPATLRTAARLSSSFAAVTQSESHWQNVWIERVSACFHSYLQPASSALAEAGRGGGRVLPLVSAPSRALPRLSRHECGSGLRIAESQDEVEGRVTRVGLYVGPLLLLVAPPVDAAAAAGARPAKSGGRSLQLRKALFFLDDGVDAAAGGRPMIDGLHVIRFFRLEFGLPPPHRREGTPLEREAALGEFLSALVYAWECCHPSLRPDIATKQGLLPQAELQSTSLFLGGGGEDLNAGDVDGDLSGVFFPVAAPAPSSSSAAAASGGVLIAPAAAGATGCCRLRHPLCDTLVYLFLLHHVTFSDVHQHAWDDERKCAICSRVLSPTGRAVEFRFFASSLRGSYPRFFMKMTFAEGDLPRTCIQEKFDRENSRSADSAAPLATSPEAAPAIATLFYGGFGRVEVDTPPTVSRAGFLRLRDALGLAPTFPMQLLWNLVLLATGVGGALLRMQAQYFALYYQTSFTAAFDELFPPVPQQT
ncbi:uncharacterized protein Tco025E_05977 [Trypanosoma conorhini]|uniref:F-box domain-containing protein n=1 Tax=Trypanosoma conorhini TaxID=83891 RepID=A0A3R7NYL5_9TRYP|nr:uncharacterized protein Tco025E_05977 [Trypanosoma conorhini]RNF14020.1 hypothetical protein Tco025E_05977 [Trypanosoma conorhini]